ncbi:MAG: hypothetical protein OHK0017_13890 [Patescibacteria group bacterium]
MHLKNLYISIGAVLLLIGVIGVLFFARPNLNQRVQNSPQSSNTTSQVESGKASLIEVASVSTTNIDLESQKLNPKPQLSKFTPQKFISKNNRQAETILTSDKGQMIKVNDLNKLIPVNQVLQGEWLDENRLLINSGKFNSNFQLEGEKGVYIYDIQNQSKVTLYSPQGPVPMFSAIKRGNYIALSTGKRVEKYTFDGQQLKTVFEAPAGTVNMYFIGQNNVPENQVDVGISNGINSETKRIDL